MRHNPRQVWEYFQALTERVLQIIESDHAFTLADLAVSGTDLIEELSLKPGPLIGKILAGLLDKVLDEPELNTRPQLLALAKAFIESPPATDAEF